MRFFRFLIMCCTFAGPATAHEFWIEPLKFQVEIGETLQANLKNGENFKGGDLSWIDRRIARAEVLVDGTAIGLNGRAGDLPAMTFTPSRGGLHQIVHETTMETITYRDPAKFDAFVKHKDLAANDDQTDTYPFTEGYTRFVKSLIGIGDAMGEDSPTGLSIELTLLDNPYVKKTLSELSTRLDYNGAPRVDAQVEIFEKAPDGRVIVTTTRTNAQGIATFPVKPGHIYLLDSVLLRRPSAALAKEHDIQWETLWAALTFAVPE